MDKFKVGDIVNYHSVLGGPVTSTHHQITHIEKRNGKLIAFITEKRGVVALNCLSKCTDEDLGEEDSHEDL